MLPSKPVMGRAVELLPPRMSCMKSSSIGTSIASGGRLGIAGGDVCCEIDGCEEEYYENG